MSTMGILGLIFVAGICTGSALTWYIGRWVKQAKWLRKIIGNNIGNNI